MISKFILLDPFFTPLRTKRSKKFTLFKNNMQVHISPIVFNAYSIANSGLRDCVGYSQIQSQLSNEHFMYSPKKFNFANLRLT